MEPAPQPSAAGFGVPQAFDAVIERGMAKSPDDRYESAGALAAAAHAALSTPDRNKASTILRASESATTQPTGAQPGAVSTAPQTAINPGTGAQPAAPPAGTGAAPEAPPAPPAPRRRQRWPIVAAAVAAVAVVGGVGTWLLLSPSDDAATTSAAKSVPPSGQATSDDEGKLLSLLPSGYGSGTCTPAAPTPGSIWAGASMMVSCGQNTQPGGPARATYALFPNMESLKKAFYDDVSTINLVDCPTEGKSPAAWQSSRSNETEGQIACGIDNDHPRLIWTFDKKLMLSEVSGGQAVDDLHKWWDAYS
jgi:serine/threonine-protein kinase